MGIATYTKYLLKTYYGLSVKKLQNIDNLFLDFNGLIHPESHHVLAKDLTGKTRSQVRTLIIKACCKKLDDMVQFAKPGKLIYIAIDGVCPVAKMIQQRLRRFSTFDADKTYFDKCEITPGTEFMSELSKELSRFCKRKYKDVKTIISDSSVPGEGEHKILNYIRASVTDAEVSVINGLDADLVMLTLATHLENLYLFRDEVESDLIKKFGKNHYLAVGKLRDAFREDINNYLKVPADPMNVINDYILLCFFGGNDFVHHLPSIEIRFDGLDKLLEIYWEFLNNNGNQYLTNGDKINFEQYTAFMKILADTEPDMIKHVGMLMERSRRRTKFASAEAKKKYYDELIDPVYNPIKFLRRGWKNRYYKELFHIERSETKDVMDVCTRYLNTIEWNLEYYLTGCKNWNQHFPYIHSPSATDIYECLKTYTPIELPENVAKTPFQQLMVVLPPQSRGVLPKNVSSLMDTTLAEFYPIKCGLEDVFCNATWQCKPKYPSPDIQLICDTVAAEIKNCTIKEKNRNKLGKVNIIN